MSLIVPMMVSAPGTASDPWTKSCCMSTTMRAGTKLGIWTSSMAIVTVFRKSPSTNTPVTRHMLQPENHGDKIVSRL